MQELPKLANVVREYMLQQDKGNTALLIDAMYHLNYTIGKSYTVGEILAKCGDLGVSERLIRTALRDPLFFRGIRETAGRPCITYRLPSPLQVRTWYMLYDVSEHSDTLPAKAFANLPTYRRYLHGAMIARLTLDNGGRFKLARVKMAQRLAVSIDTIRNYEKTFHIDVLPYIIQSALNVWDFVKLPVVNMHDHSQYLLIVRPDGLTRRYPLIRGIAQSAYRAGHKVIKCKQCANLYEWLGDFELFGLLDNRPAVTHPTADIT